MMMTCGMCKKKTPREVFVVLVMMLMTIHVHPCGKIK